MSVKDTFLALFGKQNGKGKVERGAGANAVVWSDAAACVLHAAERKPGK